MDIYEWKYKLYIFLIFFWKNKRKGILSIEFFLILNIDIDDK